MPQRDVYIGDQKMRVDSLLEEKMLNWLNDNGYAGRWRRPDVGLNSGTRNYTPDVELLIEHEGVTHIAIVEIKPVLRHARYGFKKEIFERMRVAASVYYSKMLLLYVDKTQTWYRIDYDTGELTIFGPPIPAAKTIDKAYKPLTVRAHSVGYHTYKRRLDHAVINHTVSALERGLQALVNPKKPKRRHSKKDKKNNKKGA